MHKHGVECYSESGGENLFAGERTDMDKHLVTHDKQQERIQEREAERQIVRKMKCVQNIICIIEIEADEENSESTYMGSFFFQADFIAEEIQRNQNNRKRSAKNIRQNSVTAAAYCRFKSIEMIGEEVENVVIEFRILRESSRSSRTVFQTQIGRNDGESDKPDSDHGTDGEKYAASEKFIGGKFLAVAVIELTVVVFIGVIQFFVFVGEVVLGDKINEEVKNTKEANHIRHIIVGEESESQSGYIEFTFSFVDDVFDTENDERQEVHGVNPHNIPIVRNEKSAERIHQTESRNGKIVFMERFFEEVSKNCGGERIFQKHHNTDGFGNIFVTCNQGNDTADRTGKIIVVVADEATATACIPGIQKAFELCQTVIQFGKEGTVLMI